MKQHFQVNEAQRHFYSLFLPDAVPSWTACCYGKNESNSCMESNIYSAVQHIPLKRLNLFALIVALDEQKDTMTDEKTSKASSGSLMRNVGCPPDEFSQWPPMSQLCHNDSSLYEEEVRPHETIIGPNSNLPCGRQFAGQENNLKSPFAILIK